jgi:hypothetical protein
MKNGNDNKGNPKYKQKDAYFLLASFQHLLHEFNEPFVFPSQVQHVFFCNETKMPSWNLHFIESLKVTKVVANTFDDCIDTHNVVSRLECPLKFLDIKKL